jgi:DNA-binding XRE family transcriptional regulator
MERAQSYNVDLKGFKSIPRVISVEALNDFQLSLLFSNGQYRLVGLTKLFDDVFKMKHDFFAYPIIKDAVVFNQVTIDGHSISWPKVKRKRKNFSGEEVEIAFDLDPAVLYANSVPDQNKSLNIGAMVRRERKKAGLTQEQLAEKIGTNKQYISRLENDKSDLEIQTLRKIVEGGLGKTLEISIR